MNALKSGSILITFEGGEPFFHFNAETDAEAAALQEWANRNFIGGRPPALNRVPIPRHRNFFSIRNSPRGGPPEPIGKILVRALPKLFKFWKNQCAPSPKDLGGAALIGSWPAISLSGRENQSGHFQG